MNFRNTLQYLNDRIVMVYVATVQIPKDDTVLLNKLYDELAVLQELREYIEEKSREK